MAGQGADNKIAIFSVVAVLRRNENPAIQLIVVRLNKVAFASNDVTSAEAFEIGGYQLLDDGLFFVITRRLHPKIDLVTGQNFFHLVRAEEVTLAFFGANKAESTVAAANQALIARGVVVNILLQLFQLRECVYIKHPGGSGIKSRKFTGIKSGSLHDHGDSGEIPV